MYNFLKDGTLTVADSINGRTGDFLAYKDDLTGLFPILTASREHAEFTAQEALKDQSEKWSDHMQIVTFPLMGNLLFAIFIKPLKTTKQWDSKQQEPMIK